MESIGTIEVNGRNYHVTFDQKRRVAEAAGVPRTPGPSGPEFRVEAASVEEAKEKLRKAISAQ